MQPDLKHIAFICSRLDLPGGIEKAIVSLANLFTQKGHAVTLIIADETRNSFYPLDQKIKIVQQPLSFGITEEGNVISRKLSLLTDVLKLRKIIRQQKPDLIIATEYPFSIAAVLSGAKKYATIISWEHHHYHELEKNNFWSKLYKLAYPRLDVIVCLNKDEQKLFNAIHSNCVVIPNFIELEKDSSTITNRVILTVARLTYVKGIDLLLPAAKLVLNQYPDWKWKIIGNGEMEESCREFARKEHLAERLIFQAPVSNDIVAEYQHAGLYVMTSRNECFPMVLLEAQSAGLPCVAFNCETGPRHIIHHGEDGLLAEAGNEAVLANAIASLITNEEERRSMGRKAMENVKQFSEENVYRLWESLLSLTSFRDDNRDIK